jgi:acetyl esterase/lipase
MLASLISAAPPPAGAEEKAKDPTKPAKAYEVKTVKDVVYYDGEGRHKVKHKLDLYLPAGAKGFPVLLFVHGGAWLHGDKDFGFGFYGSLAKVYARQGVGVAVTNYRLSPEVKHPEHVKDVARAVTHARKGLPPFLILYADRDLPGCDKAPSEHFCKVLKEKGTPAKTLEVKSSDHYRIIISAASGGSLVSDAILDFIRAGGRK